MYLRCEEVKILPTVKSSTQKTFFVFLSFEYGLLFHSMFIQELYSKDLLCTCTVLDSEDYSGDQDRLDF